MELMELLQARYSLRDYDSRPVEDEKLQMILEAGRIAPTARNFQPVRVYVLRSEEALEKIRGISRCAFNAPVVLVIAADHEKASQNVYDALSYEQIDSAIALTQMLLMAQSLGLGTCVVGAYDREQVKKAFALPENETVWSLLPIGYPALEAKPGPNHGKREPLSAFAKEL